MLPVFSDGRHSVKENAPRVGCLGMLRHFFKSVFESRDSRNLFMFLLCNLSFAFVEMFYGIWSNSLGLISDSCHMLFDSSALVAGLVAQLIAKRKSNEHYSYGYGRAEVLGGFMNGLFLVFISFFVFKEAVERFFDPPEVHAHRMLTVSIMGLFVNLIGIFVFNHGGGHGHSHGGSGGHGHSHSFSLSSPPEHAHNGGGCSGHGHEDSHGHSHGGHRERADSFHYDIPNSPPPEKGRSFVMDGVFLHVLADALGSVGVIISSLIIHNYGWMIADPICSIFISVMIFASVIPLLSGAMSVLMQRTPDHLEPLLVNAYHRITRIDGVISYRDPHFWSMTGTDVQGTLVVIIKHDANDTAVRLAVSHIFRELNVTQLILQLERY